MTRSMLWAALAASALVVGPAAANEFTLMMTGDQEAPNPGDPDGIAIGTLSIDPDTNEVSWSFTYENIAAPTQMHIHTGAAGVPGPVLVNLGVGTSGGPGTLDGTTTTSAANVANILANPAGFYVNIHNAPFPAGAVRGQLVPSPPQKFFLNMTGDQEAPGPGDKDGVGTGTIIIDPGTNTISWDITYKNIAPPTAMHIHPGAAGVPGPVLVSLGVETSGGPGTLIGSTTTTRDNVAAILADPAGHYVNIHNEPFPAGAIRSQLLTEGPTPCPADLDGTGEVDGADLGALLAAWGTNDEQADFDGSGEVDGADLGFMLAAWGPCP